MRARVLVACLLTVASVLPPTVASAAPSSEPPPSEVACGGLAPAMKSCVKQFQVRTCDLAPFVDTIGPFSAVGYNGTLSYALTAGNFSVLFTCAAQGVALSQTFRCTGGSQGTCVTGGMATLRGDAAGIGSWRVGASW